MTIKQKRARASRAAKQRGIVKAVKGLLKKTNPSAKITGARVVKLRDGGLKITPIKANPGTGGYVDTSSKAAAVRMGRKLKARGLRPESISKHGAKYRVVYQGRK